MTRRLLRKARQRPLTANAVYCESATQRTVKYTPVRLVCPQENTADGAKQAPALSNGHHPPNVDKPAVAAAAAAQAGREAGDTNRTHDADHATAGVSAGGEGTTAAGEQGGAVAEEEGKEGLAQCLAELSGSVPDFPGLEEKAGALLVRRESGKTHGISRREVA